MPDIPAKLWIPHAPWDEPYARLVEEGRCIAKRSSVAFVGLARDCDARLHQNLSLLERTAGGFAAWQLHIEANDCVDDTLGVLASFCGHYNQATFHYQTLGRKSYVAEFGGRRTIALAEYRDACQRWVRDCAEACKYVVVVDWDAAGGWNEDGVLTGLAWLERMPDAYGMTSVSLFQYDFGRGPQWCHYDLWALRGVGQRGCYWDTYQNGYGGFGFSWLPPVGSPPVLVSSAFGGMAIYRTHDYLAGTYDGTNDCEHVTFHKSITSATGRTLYLNPSQRMLMSWMESDDGGQHSHD